MSIQFGMWNFDGQPVNGDLFNAVSGLTAKYAPDSVSSCLRGAVGMLYRALHTTKESCDEIQPVVSPIGIVLTWDGRLDNRTELIRQLNCGASDTCTDADLVMECYKKWDIDCLSKLIGDWALAVWNPVEQVLTLAKDFLGLRQLYYSIETRTVTWSSVLDPLVLLVGHPFKINEEWVAGYLSTYPATHLTPYEDIYAVAAGSVVRITCHGATTCDYLSFHPDHKTRYSADQGYEEHFRSLFAQAVHRRIRRSPSVLAELSGGIDSASIVCTGDHLLRTSDVGCRQLNTISYFDDREPNWNERPYFALVEHTRGREGYHVDVGNLEGYLQCPDESRFIPLPGPDQVSIHREERILECLDATNSRVVLSGIGGDEFLGGVPNPKPEIQDLFIQLRWLRLGQQLKKWSLQKRLPLLHMLFSSLEEFLPQALRRVYKKQRIEPWLEGTFLERHMATFWADSRRVTLTGPRPAFQGNVNTMNHLRRQFGCSIFGLPGRYEYSYPFLDRDLLEFLFSIPRDQLVRPGQRRSLMRRALVGIVPDEILFRKRKAYVARYPLIAMNHSWKDIQALLVSSYGVANGWFERRSLAASLVDAKEGKIEFIGPLLRTLKLELWICLLARQGLVCTSASSGVSSSRNPRTVSQRIAVGHMTLEREQTSAPQSGQG